METLFVGHEIRTFNELKSTNEYLRQLCIDKLQTEGLTITAEYQTSGRGQFGNSWESERGANLLVSVLLRPKFLSPDRQFHLNMSVCLAIYDSLNEISPGFQVKWPNDILYDGKKVGGILIENSLGLKTIESSIIGFGINTNQQKFSDPIIGTSVRNIVGHEVEKTYLLRSILKNIEARYLRLKSNPKKLYSDYCSALYGYNSSIPIRIGGQIENIVILGVEPSGKLIADMKGQKRKFDFKEISFVLA